MQADAELVSAFAQTVENCLVPRGMETCTGTTFAARSIAQVRRFPFLHAFSCVIQGDECNAVVHLVNS